MFKTRAVSDLNSFKNVPLVFYFNWILSNALKKEKAVKITNATLVKYYANWLKNPRTQPQGRGMGGGGGYSTKFYTGRVRHVVQPFTSFYISFLTEKVPPTGKWYAFHIPNNRCIPLTVVNALSFKYEILAKLCLKPENGTPEFPPATHFLKASICLRNTALQMKEISAVWW